MTEIKDQITQNFAAVKFICEIPEEYEHYKEYCVGFEWNKKGCSGCEHCDYFLRCNSDICKTLAAVNYLREQGVWKVIFMFLKIKFLRGEIC
jgi:hypothetical protein